MKYKDSKRLPKKTGQSSTKKVKEMREAVGKGPLEEELQNSQAQRGGKKAKEAEGN